MWLWTLDPDFRLEPESVAPQYANSANPADYYLLNVMVEFCTEVPTKSMEELIEEIIHDRDLYQQGQISALQQIFRAPTNAVVHLFP